MLVGGTASNAQIRAVGNGFWQRGQDDLLQPYVDRYLEALPGSWERTSPQMAAWITQHGFPITLIEPSVAERVGALLARDDLSPGLRRVVLELHDDLQRALRAQAAGLV
jgi:aminopeptidase N